MKTWYANEAEFMYGFWNKVIVLLDKPVPVILTELLRDAEIKLC